MITPTHDEVHPLSGIIFFLKFLVLVDEYAGIFEQCPTRNTRLAANMMNRWFVRCGSRWDNNGIEVSGLYG
jgi:hypothetical protein